MKQIARAPVYAIGPLVRKGEAGDKSEFIRWLDGKPKESVVYVSFGSGGTISAQQTIELAWGLELSNQRFIWVVRPPIEDDTSASFLDRFLDRTRETGFVVPMWAPQEEILSHHSIGGFVCHCGWNSSLESIVNGVPIIAWPLYAEQRMNATMLAKSLVIAVQPRVMPDDYVVRRDEIAKMVRRVMVEGVAIKTRVNELKASGNKALKEGGSSYSALSQVIKKLVT
ncbi:Anthocyanidin 3-O-glucosyltransferase 5 [Bienertia sinuspersici]